MNKNNEIKNIEHIVRSIFKKDVITTHDVEFANFLLKQWKKLTKYKEETSSTVESVLDKEPKWQTKK